MRTLPLARASRMGLPIALALILACAEDPGEAPVAGLLTDYAAGVDASFGVKAFALGPTLSISSPTDFETFSVPLNGKTDVSVKFAVEGFTLGKVVCYLNGVQNGVSTATPYVFKDLTKGLHTLGCVLATDGGQEQSNPEARATVRVKVISDCKVIADCDDGLACVQDNCVDGKCTFEAKQNCCGSSFDCAVGDTCLNPNTETSKCSACLKDADCDDAEPCTVNTCDLSGPKGVCQYTKGDTECCSKQGVGQCDDGKGCTVDACDLNTKKCTHIKPPGVCCSDAECASDDICKVGACVDAECRFGPDKWKPDCCSDLSNINCDDKYYCNIDKCNKEMPGGWKQCTHTPDPNKTGPKGEPCCDPLNQTDECDDGNSCTWDICTNYLCENKIVGDCCLPEKEEQEQKCNDQNPCTLDSCEVEKPGDPAGKCKHAKIAGCCTQAPDCDDGQFCTTDQCNTATLSCINKKDDDKCCDVNKQCDDGKFCTTGFCVNHGCYFGKDAEKPAPCCDVNADCNDNNACTTDACNQAVNLCVFSSIGDANCCNSPADCDDQDCTTTDFCDAANQCAHKQAPYACKANIDCDDGKPCTKDICDASAGCGVCKNEPDATCCELDGQCNDGKPCTLDKCVNNKCDSSGVIADCCENDIDAPVACDDDNKCTIEYCVNNQCRHTTPKNGCCASDGDCDDGGKCTTDKCELNGGKDGVCSHTLVGGCTGCVIADECDDGNPCTVEACVNLQCTHTPKKDCCLDKFDCDDGNPCTYDGCVFNACWHSEAAGGEKLCCTVETEAIDCADKNSECGVGKCKQQPDGKFLCVEQAKPVCTFDIGYCQDFESSASLPLMGWNPGDLAGSAKGNWGVDTDAGLGPDQHARLLWTPVKTNYDTCLASPVFQAAGAQTITMQFDREFIKNLGTTNVRVLGSLDGENADWSKGVVIDTWNTGKSIAADTIDVTLPPILSGSNGLRLAFCVSGDSTFDLTKVGVDNFCIAKGSAPNFVSCPPNQAAELGFIKKIPIKATDADAADVISFSLVKAPPFVTLSTALFYWLDNTWNATLSVNSTSKEEIGEHEITVKVTDGKLYKLCTFRLTILYKGGVVVWRPVGVPKAHSEPLVSAIKGASGKIVQVIDDISLYPDLKPFDAVFVLLGVYPDNHVLQDNEISALKSYLSTSGKGRVYLEGGDTWAFDKSTTLHPFFKITGLLDSAPNGVTGPLDGNSVYNDANNPTKVFNWGYSQSFAYNNLNDQIGGQTDVKRTGNLLSNAGIEKFWVHVGHDNKAASYRTIGSSVLFSGVTEAGDTPLTLMKRIFNFFDNGFPDCAEDKDCDDGSSCTTDKCLEGGDCSHSNTCLCDSQTQLKCDDSPKNLVTNGGNSTQSVESYPCDLSNTKYDGKEVSYGFKSAESRPISVKFTNVNNAKARVFVLKATDKGCDPTGCIGTAAIVDGAATLNFAAGAGVQYHLVVDVPGALNSAKFDMAISCAEGEICDDGKDNNLNGMTDCYDLGSCCGDNACPEVCDGLDNDCNGKTDEGCDDDGDLYCDKAMMVMKGAKCSGSAIPTEAFKQVPGDDCSDDDGTVNPGTAEVCKNDKDDNCNGVQDEQDAVGCVKYYEDLDSDDYGTGQPKCLCAVSGSFKATVPGDCNDGTKDINPGVTEKCVTESTDDNCDGSTNDLNAEGCSNFFTDLDSDAWGTTPFKCICVAEGSFKAPKPGDCDDAVAVVNPAAPEACNNVDDNCDGTTDEGCDDDADDYCDADIEYDPKAEPIAVCPKGAGDSDDEDPEINPAGKEICDDKDNDSDGKTDEDCNKDGDTYCDAKIVTVGKPKVCTDGGGDCVDDDPKVNPGYKETCDTSYDDNCNNSSNDIDATNCTPYFNDSDDDKWGTSSHQCLCEPKDAFKAVNPGDCKDGDPSINPAVVEVCDNIDNDCDGVVDNSCDEDKDGYCNSLVKIVGTPTICPSGSGDCDDSDGNVNPSKAEICGNGKDDNCDGSQNDEGAVGCNNFWPDSDDDGFGDDSLAAQCLCEAKGLTKATNNGDCNDKNAAVNPVVSELCDDADNDCDGKTDEGCDDDKDGYCDGDMLTVGNPAICQNGAGDCNDLDPNVYKGKSAEICDGKDDDCNGVADNGCDKDQDGYCDLALIVSNPPPAACVKGGGDCDDLNYDANPGVTEVCNNNINDNCNKNDKGEDDENDENALGCVDFYFDGDGDGFGLNLSKCLCTGAGSYTAAKGGDCADDTIAIKPGAAEVCDGVDNNCDNVIDEPGAGGCKEYYLDNDGDGYGLDIKQCLCGAGASPYTAIKKGDCNDEVKGVNPGVTEVCDDADNNCDSQVDEKCNKDGDKFCDVAMTVIGSPAACVLGGGDCDDDDALVNPAGNEICNDKDDNCDSKIDVGCDDDKDGYCDANMGIAGIGDKELVNHDFSAGVPAGWTASSAKTTACGAFGTILGGVNEFGTGAYAEHKLSNIALHKSLKIEFDFIKIDSWDGESGQLFVDGKQVWAKSYTYTSGSQQCGSGGGWNETNERITAIVAHTANAATLRFTTTLDQAASDESWGLDNVVITAIGSTPKICVNGGGDCNDNAVNINPGQAEVCGNTTDENCSGDANDIDAQGCSVFYKDLDADGYGANGDDKLCRCKAAGAYVGTKAGDCDDGNNLVNEGATEVCDGLDNNCDGKIDEGCDNDGDGYCDDKMSTIGKPAVCPNGGGDCNDDNDLKGVINPGAVELCGNNVDENCDGSLNANAAGDCTVYFYDGDGDGFGVNVKQCLCTPENGFTASKAGDCDDSNKAINPDAIEVCGNGFDDNCNGTSNEKDAQGCSTFYGDQDADGYGAGAGQCQCSAEGAFITKTAGDCDDLDKNTHPGAAEICDGKDNSCAGTKDKGCDDDNDQYCDAGMTVIKGALCLKSVPVCEGVIYNSKCYQAFPTLKTRASAKTACETIGGGLVTIANFDENVAAEGARKKACGNASAFIGLNDEAVEGTHVWDDKSPLTFTSWAANKPDNAGGDSAVALLAGGTWDDVDGNVGSCYICELGKVSIGQGDDCADTDATVNPGIIESCDDKDNNCDGKADEQCDDDKDGYCNKARNVVGKPNVCVNGGGDCDDSNNLIFPGKFELCDDKDNNCDSSTDEGCDDDKDGYCDIKMSTLGTPEVCTGGGGDCNDLDKTINPGASEVCNGKDDNCAAGIDEICNDEDKDGYCKGNVPPDANCPKGGNDCDDSNADVNPGAKENCLTDTDDNCNKKINEPDALNCKIFYNDLDGDGYGNSAVCDGTTIDSMCLKAVSEERKAFKQSTTWDEARDACLAWGGDLVSVTSDADNAEVLKSAAATCGGSNAWIGLKDKSGGPGVPVTFNNCGKTGRDGPSQSNCNSSYNGTPLAGKVTIASGVQKWTVPVTGTYIIEAYGARGYNGGYGARMKGEFQLNAGQVLDIVVGQMGLPGGGNGGGGGGSFVYTGNTLYMAAGGGGGQSPGYHGTTANNGTNGNNGSGGTNGNAGTGTHYDGSGPGAGWNSYDTINDGSNAIGAKSRPTWTGGRAIRHGYTSDGGFGGGGFSIHPAGGGGGYSGGGAGGGGGGSFNNGGNQSNTSGANSTHGKVIITPPKPTQNNEQMWSDGTGVGYTNFAAGQPSDNSSNPAGVEIQAADGKWNDVAQGQKVGCYVCRRSRTWGQAQEACQAWGGSLASITSDAENSAYLAVAKQTCGTDNAWIGLRDKPAGLGEPVTFSNCGKTGRFGPNQTECNTTYAGTPLENQVTVAGGVQSWTVPADGTYEVEAFGARGYNGGNGARMKGKFEFKAGQVLQIVIGQMGLPGGGNGGGGGGSFVYTGNTLYMAAGGGGGQSPGYAGTTANNGTNGSNGSGGSNGSAGTGSYMDGSGPGAGWNGYDTLNDSNNAIGAKSRPSWEGGRAIRHGYTSDGGFGGGGFSIHPAGGGGGYSGGGAGGGGGGSYNTGTDQSNASGANNTHGKVIITSPKAASGVKEWVDGLPVGFTNWAINQPDGKTPAGCDVDKDGYDSVACGGKDCDDTNGKVHPFAGDAFADGVDSDCDKLDCQAAWSGDAYLLACPEDVSWQSGKTKCEAAGYKLASIRSAVDQSAFEALAMSAEPPPKWSNYWFGYTDVAANGKWVWSDGYAGPYTHWKDGEPDGGPGDCATFIAVQNYPKGQAGYWAENQCASSAGFGYFCRSDEKQALPGGSDADPATVVELLAADGKWNDIASDQKRSCYVCKRMPASACMCFQQGTLTGLKGGDCDDTDPVVNPLAIEICDGVDNDCLNGPDDGCDDDKDGFCASGKLIGEPPVAEKLVFTSDFEVDSNNWTGSATTVTNCGAWGQILGGYNVYGAGATAKRVSAALASHTHLRVTFHFLKLDDWEGEAAQLKLDGKQIWTKSYTNTGSSTCGNGSADAREKIQLLVPHTNNVATLEWSSALNEGSTNESWGLDNVTVQTVTQVGQGNPCPKTGTVDTASCSTGKLYDTPPYIGKVINMDTRSHGGGFHAAYNEWWYPQWSGTTVYRYHADTYQYLGTFGSGQNCMMQLWADTDGNDTDFYTANWGYNTVSRIKGKSSTKVWNFNVGSTSGTVATDTQYAYAARHSGRTVYVLNKANGSQVKTFNLNNGQVNYSYGGLAVIEDKLYYGNGDRRVDRFNVSSGNWDGGTFTTAPNIYNMAFNGQDYCVSSNNSSVYCYTILKGKTGCTTGDDCDDKDAQVNPANAEICDDKDNNCDLFIDDKCDLDQDGYCSPEAGLPFGNCCDGHGGKGCNVTAIKDCVCAKAEFAKCCNVGWDKSCATAAATLGCTACKFPSTCAKGGSDCDDKNSSINLEAEENCTTPDDDNCDGVLDVLNGLGCTKFYYDGDADGAGTPNYECRCAPNGKFVALSPGDCDDEDPVITSGVIIKQLDSPSYIGSTVNMNTRSHGGGYSPTHGEYWYPEWAGQTVYRYDSKYQYKGTFNTGVNSMMQLYGDPAEDTYYTANWGYNTITKRKGMTNQQLWSFNIGSTAGAVTSDGKTVYAMRADGTTMWVLNRSTGQQIKTMNLSGGSFTTTYGGLVAYEGKLWRGNYNGSVYRYNLTSGQYDGGQFNTATSIYNMAFDGERYCISSNNSTVYCYRMFEKTTLPEVCDGKDNNCNATIDEGCDQDKDGYCGPEKVVVDNKACPKSPQGKAKCTPSTVNDSPSYIGSVKYMNTRSHGGGFAPKYNEYWYPQWSGQTIYRYDGTSLGYKGAFNSGQNCMMQLWGDTDGSYYTANWGYSNVTKKTAYSSNTLWTRSISGTTGCVSADQNYVYAMNYYNNNVYRLNKANGNVINTFGLSGGYISTGYGSLAAVDGKLWRGSYNRRVDRWDASSGQYDGKTFYTAPYIYNMAFNGKEYCVSQNNSSVYCYTMFVKGDCTMGNDCDDNDNTIYPSPDENICDEKDNNCNGIIDDGCDKDSDGYCDKNKTVLGAPAICTGGGGDCNDGNSSISPGAKEVCANSIDDNCNGTQDEEDAIGCTGWYYDGDQDGYGLSNNFRCLCKTDGLYTTTKSGDCNDSCPDCYPNAPEVCDGLNNKCGSTLKSSVGQSSTLTIDTRSHGGGFAPVYQEFWYPAWAGSTIYRYAAAQGNQYLGTFNSGQSSMMQVWAVGDEGGDYYTANWGYNKVYKWKSKSATKVWEYDVGSTAGGITTDGKWAYAMRNTGNTVWMLDRVTGKLNKTFNLSGGSVQQQYGSMVALEGRLYRGNGSSRSVYRYLLADGKYDGMNFNVSQDIYNMAFTGDDYCITPNNSSVLCYKLTQPTTAIDVDCDKDGDGYCDINKKTIGKPASCPKGGLDCNDAAKTVNPGAPELCNAKDDNCNKVVDEGASDTCNKEIYQAQSKCDAAKGQCVILSCSDSFFDANGLVSDGCECSGNDAWEPNNSCNAANEITKNLNDSAKGSLFTVTGKLVQAPDVDWYKFYAVDETDSGTSVCDRFNVRVRFLKNPGGLAMDVHRGGCPGPNNMVCCGRTDFNWFTNYRGYTKNPYSSYESEFGECPCSTNNNYWSTRTGYNSSPGNGGPWCKKWSNGVCIPRGYDYTRCSNDSNWFYVKVYKKSGGPSCTEYQLEVTNAIYGAPGNNGKNW